MSDPANLAEAEGCTSHSSRQQRFADPLPPAAKMGQAEAETEPPPYGRPLTALERAVQAELEMLGPAWAEAIWGSHPSASQDQANALIAVKLNEAGQLIPRRWQAERRFEDDCRIVEQMVETLSQVIEDLQAKEAKDESARIEYHQAQRLIADWESLRRPALERSYRMAADVWFQPGEDPLTRIFSTVTNLCGKAIARLEFEISARPALGHALKTPESVVPRPTGDGKTIIQFDAAALVQAFDGDINDPEVLLNFSNWKSSWASLVKEMETLRGFDQTTLFQKLKTCLAGPALTLVSGYSSESTNSYEAAMKDLVDKYQDPITLAGSYINSGLKPRKTAAEQAEAIRNSFKALHNMRDIFEREQVDMYDFALMRTFITAMPAESQALWTTNKIQKKQDHLLKCDEAAKKGEELPGWKAGLVENYDQFDAWLRLQSVQFRQPVGGESMDTAPQSTASNFAMTADEKVDKVANITCFICPPEKAHHALANCRKGLAMSAREWRITCYGKNRCFRCTNPFSQGHQCQVKCRLCIGKGYDVSHHILVCPRNEARTSPLVDYTARPKPNGRPTRNKRENSSRPEASVPKWAKEMQATMESLAKQTTKERKDKPSKKLNKKK
ncbi:uncharacterized protein LOC131891978 [Tigriopus californicus]|uniref:uncharacterized protein LOC131891978 n=1 Tax=Tigriopus californicus TaxID=6832 RepID=UPI0027D9F3FD|nr:uncharacterized protein LOC131891978 [Tigriopus californicus]